MSSHFRRNVATTAGFFALRFIVALFVSVLYILAAAAIQYLVVRILGESTFNYIVGGGLSLLLGIVICNALGSLAFMFVRGWHVAALAYVPKIRKSGAPAVLVGIKAFNKNIVGFGAVYGVRALAKNLLSDFKDKLWELLKDVPYAQNLKSFAENPIVEHIAMDVLNYGFDATIFYLIKHPPEDLENVPSTVLEGLKRYLYCLPSIMLTSLTSFLLFRILPKVLKWALIIWVFMTHGLMAGLLITVLMWPIFYILDSVLFQPLTMIMFISCYSKQCSKEIDADSPVVKYVNSVLEGEDIGTSSEDLGEEDSEEDAKSKSKSRKVEKHDKEQPDPVAESTNGATDRSEPSIDVEPDLSELPSIGRDEVSRRDVDNPNSNWANTEIPRREDGGLSWDDGDIANLPLAEEGPDSAFPGPARSLSSIARGGGFGGGDDASSGMSALQNLVRGFNARDLNMPPPDFGGPESNGQSDSELNEILGGDSFDD